MQLTFGEIEQIIGGSHSTVGEEVSRSWWGNEAGPTMHTQSHVWMENRLPHQRA